jgi:hypothetical protein
MIYDVNTVSNGSVSLGSTFSFTTTLDYEASKREYQSFVTTIQLRYNKTKEVFATIEFDIGNYANNYFAPENQEKSTVKHKQRVKSARFPGSVVTLSYTFTQLSQPKSHLLEKFADL